ncbi:DUF5662 family protein [uncultured Mitsuokella sp.]|uniref:DUF5662 family protein n=1 Tax=uncultured Mitsuokella sp. TaxID=453120 RepID=UPI0025D61434|nr:DUF5662 family protein [uncultured Mitsuokella sp.]
MKKNQEVAAELPEERLPFLRRLLGHTWMVLRHKYWVFHYACIAGIPWQGLTHDLSKFSRIEFWESVRYYNGVYSPIRRCKELNNGYSLAWIHHKGRNLHHYEAWWDNFDRPEGPQPIDMPYNYAAEMVCDCLAAARAYGRKNFSYQAEYEWWQRKRAHAVAMTEHMQGFMEEVLSTLARTEDASLLRPENLRPIYDRHVPPRQ